MPDRSARPWTAAIATLLLGAVTAGLAMAADAPEAPPPEPSAPAPAGAETATPPDPSAPAAPGSEPAAPDAERAPSESEAPAPVEAKPETETPAAPEEEAPAPAETESEAPPPAEAETESESAAPSEEAAPAAEAETEADEAATPAAPPAATAPSDEIRFQFDGIPYNEVIRRFAQARAKPIIGEYNVEGTLTFFDPRPYTPDEAFDTLNLILAMKGHALVETERFVRVVPIKEYTKAPVRILRGWDDTDDLRPGELATVMLPLKFMTAEDAVRVLMPVVSSFGSVAPLGSGRGIIVTDRAKNLKRIRLILDELDTGTLSAETVLKTYSLKHAAAGDVQKVIEDLFASAAQMLSKMRYIRDKNGRMVRNPNYGKPSPKGEEDLVVTADARTNTLFLAGPGEKIALAEQVVEQLDSISPEQTGDMRVFDLKNARAEDLANTVKQLLPDDRDGRRWPPGRGDSGMGSRVVADPNTNRLIVTASLDQMARIEEIIQTLDQASEEVGGMRVFRLKVADARQLAEVVSHAVRRGGDRRRRDRSAMGSAVSADSRTNSLIVSGNAADIQRAEQLITELDRPLDAQARDVHVVPLKAGDADDIADALNRMLSHSGGGDGRRTAGPVHVAAEDDTNTLFISAGPEDWPRVQKILDDLEASVAPQATSTTRMLPLAHADADDVARSLNEIYRPKMMAKARMNRGEPFVPVIIAASEQSNALIVSGPDDEQETIAELVQSMDTPETEAAEKVHVVQLKDGDAVRIADTLRDLQPRGDDRAVIRGDADSNTILVRASDEALQGIKALIDELDRTITTSGGLQAFRLKVADAEQLVGILRSALSQRRGERRYDEGGPVVTADSRTNSLLVSGTAADIQTARQLVEQLDHAPEREAREIHVVPLETGDADDIANALNRMLTHSAAGGRRTAGTVHVAAEDDTNTLFISAAPDDWAAIEKMLKELKASAAPHQMATTRHLKLQHAEAEEVARTLRQLYAAEESSSRYRNRYRRRATRDGRSVPVTIAANERTNSLLISASDEDQQTIGEMIQALDVSKEKGTAPVRIIRLASADADKLAETLRAALPKRTEPGAEPVVIQADSRAGALLIRAPEAERKRLEEMIATLDEATQAQVRETRMIELKHTAASKLARMFSQLYAAGSSGSSYSRYASRRSDEAGGVVVAAAPGDKTLVVEAPRRKMQEIADLVTSLDVEEATDGIQVRTYWMEDSDAEDLARSLARLMAEQRDSAAAGEPRARFEADEGTNQLMVAATAEQFKTIEQLIENLQARVQVAQEMKTFHLKAAKADEVVQVLRTMLLERDDNGDGEGRRRAEPEAVRLASVDETNDVVVRAPPDQLALAVQLIEMLDTEAAGAKTSVVIVPLKNAQATGLAQSLTEVLSSEQASSRSSRYRRYRRSSGSDKDRVTVTAEPNSNSLLVRGPAEEIPAVVEMIRELDAGSTGMGAEVRVYPLENSEPYELVQSLRSLFRDMLRHESERRGGDAEIPFSVAADARTRSLVVSTTPAHFTLVEQILESLDKAPAAPEADVQYIWLENADATAVADQLNAMYEDHKGTRPVIAADEFSNSLTVIAKDEELKVIEPIVAKLDEASGTGRRIRVVPLMDVQAGRMADLLRTVYKQLTGNEVRITSERPKTPVGAPGPSGASGPPAPAGAGETESDTQAEASGANAKPEIEAEDAVAPAEPAETPDNAAETEPMAADDAGEAASKSPVTIAVDEATNSLILSGSRQEVEYLESLIDELSLTAMDVAAEFRSFKIEKADPQSVARTLDELFNPKPKPLPKDYKGAPPPSPPPVISVVSDLRTRLVIVRAKPVDFQAVEDLVKQLDQVPTIVSEVRIFHLKHTTAKDVAENLQDLFQRAAQQRTAPQKQPQKKQPQGKAKRPTPQKQRAEMIREVLELRTDEGVTQVDLASMVNVSANEPTNSVIVTAPADAMGIVADIVEELDQSAQGATPSVRLYPIAHGDVVPMVKELREVFAEDRKRRGKPSPDVVITGDEAARTVVVSAPAEEHERIGEVIRELDRAQAAGAVAVQVYRLENADATTVAAALTETVKRAGKDARGGPGEVRISADRSGNSVVVRAAAEDHERIGRLIQDMDTVPEAVIRTYAVKNAQVQTVVEALKEVFASRTGRAAGAGRGPAKEQVAISGDEAGRLVVVSAPEATHTLVKKVIDEIDSAQSQEQVVVKVYRLKHAGADDVAEALQSTLQQASSGGGSSGWSPWRRYQPRQAATGQIRINPDESSNSLIVRASAPDHERIEALLKDLDVAQASQYAVRLIPLRNADPDEVENVLERVFESGTRRRWGAPAPRESVVIEASADASMIAVRADDETFEKIEALVKRMDEASTGTDLAPTLIPLKFAKAAAVAEAVGDAFRAGRGTRRGTSAQDRVSVVAEPGSNSLIVTANAENLEKVRGLLAKLDTKESGGVTSEMLRLENARAEDVAPVLQEMAEAASGGTTRSRWSAAGAAARPSVAVSAEKGSNTLVVSGPAADVERILGMARNLDQATSGTASSVHVIQLENGEAPDVATMIQDLYRQQYLLAMRQQRSIEPLAVSADARANALVLAAGDEMFKQVSEWVKQIETMQPVRGTLRIINLKHADPAEVEAAIQRLFGEEAGRSAVPVRRRTPARGRRGPRGAPGPAGPAGPAGRVETTVLPQQKSILINASDEDFEAIRQLAEALDEAAADARRQFEVFALEHTSNTKIATALGALYRQAAATQPEDQVTVTALPDTNAVVVSATAARLEEVGHLIEQLDREEIAPQLEFRIVQLQNAQPTKVLPILEQMLTQVRQTRPDEPVDVQADERTRSIIVTARGTMFEQVERIIQTLDQQPAFAGADVLIIPLKKADATRLAQVLSNMLRPSPATQITPEARALQEQVRLLQVKSADGRKIPELDLTQPIKITADPVIAGQQGANALLISSTPDNLKAMAAIVDVLDTVPVAEGTRVRVVHLKNADAASVRDILADIFEKGERLAGKPESSIEGRAEPESMSGKALTNPLNVSADPRTNSLVLSGVEESLALADIIIADLDRDAGALVTEVRLFRLKHASAERLAPMLEAVFAETQATPPGAEGLRTQVTRLRTVLKDKIGHVTERAKAREALSIQADPTTNIIVVAARSDVMPLIADVVDTMDVPGAGSLTAVRIFPLENADATRLKDLIDGLYAGPNAQFVRPEDVPTVTVDTRTNALVVSASESTFVMIDTLMKRLDAEQPIELREIRLVNLKNAEAASLAPVLQEMMDARVQRLETLGAADAEALRMIIAADERSNSLIVGGSAEGFKIVEGLAAQLDGASPAISGQIQILPLEHANAGTLSESLANLFDERYAAARTEDVRRQKPVILPDLRINALLVAANADDSKILKSLLEKLDVELTDPSVRLTVLPLRFNDAGIVGPTLEDLFASRLESMTPPGQEPMPQDRVDVAIDALSNSLIISASKENLGLIQDLLKKVDVAPPDETGIVRLYPLKTADAQRVATMLEGLVSQGFYKPGVILAGDSTLVQAREKVAIAVDVRTNVLIVSASKENFAVIEEIIRTVDSSEDFSVLGDIRLFTLENADATRLAPTLQQLFDAKRQAEVEAGSAGRMLPVSVIPDGRTNTLLVTGSRESLRALEVMIQDLDAEQVLAANEFKVFYLENATATVLQPTLEQVFTQRVTRGEAPAPVTVVSEPRTNALLVSGSPDDLRLAESLIERLDAKPDRPGTAVRVFALKKGDATQVAETLRTLYEQPGAAGATVGISIDERINAILVSAGPADLERMEQLVDELDTDSVPRVTEIRVFTLKNADAAELAQILNDALNQKPDPLTEASPNRQALLQFISRTEDGAEEVASALQEGVLITPDTRTNSLVISAPTENMRLLEKLVRAMDDTQPRTAEIRVFTLVNSDARAMAQVLSELFRMGQTAADRQAVEYRLVPEPGAGGREGGTPARVGSAQDAALTVTVDVRTNSLLVGGTRHYVHLASEVIQELDQSTASERLTEVYRLRNAQAADIETAVSSFLDQERTVLEESLGGETGGTLPFLLEREVAIVAESASNTLLLSASPRYYQVIADMIEELDRPPPQVLIQVLLADVTIDDTEEFGIEWNVQERWRSHDVFGGTAPAFSASAGLTLNPGFTVSVTGGDANFLLRAIEAQGRVEILSRPQVLATDNQLATINIGQRVPFITNSRITDDGTTVNTIQYEDVGIILNVTPRITPDGFVRMEVNPEISSIDDSTVPISENVNAIIVNSRSAETTVTVQDGHTIVVGGLIRTTDRDRVNKVPVLGDMPLLGNLFRSTRKVKERAELLIILTPTILQNTEDVDAKTDSEVRRLDLLRASHDGGVRQKTLETYGEELFDEFRLQSRPGEAPADADRLPPDDAAEPPEETGARGQPEPPAEAADAEEARLAIPARREDPAP